MSLFEKTLIGLIATYILIHTYLRLNDHYHPLLAALFSMLITTLFIVLSRYIIKRLP
jgi:hypothetical protein